MFGVTGQLTSRNLDSRMGYATVFYGKDIYAQTPNSRASMALERGEGVD